MIKFASLLLDFHDDAQFKIAHALPADFHSLSINDAEALDALPDHAFALVVKTASGLRRRFPLHDADHLKLSEAYFAETKHMLPAEAVQMATAKFAAATAGAGGFAGNR